MIDKIIFLAFTQLTEEDFLKAKEDRLQDANRKPESEEVITALQGILNFHNLEDFPTEQDFVNLTKFYKTLYSINIKFTERTNPQETDYDAFLWGLTYLKILDEDAEVKGTKFEKFRTIIIDKIIKGRGFDKTKPVSEENVKITLANEILITLTLYNIDFLELDAISIYYTNRLNKMLYHELPVSEEEVQQNKEYTEFKNVVLQNELKKVQAKFKVKAQKDLYDVTTNKKQKDRNEEINQKVDEFLEQLDLQEKKITYSKSYDNHILNLSTKQDVDKPVTTTTSPLYAVEQEPEKNHLLGITGYDVNILTPEIIDFEGVTYTEKPYYKKDAFGYPLPLKNLHSVYSAIDYDEESIKLHIDNIFFSLVPTDKKPVIVDKIKYYIFIKHKEDSQTLLDIKSVWNTEVNPEIPEQKEKIIENKIFHGNIISRNIMQYIDLKPYDIVRFESTYLFPTNAGIPRDNRKFYNIVDGVRVNNNENINIFPTVIDYNQNYTNNSVSVINGDDYSLGSDIVIMNNNAKRVFRIYRNDIGAVTIPIMDIKDEVKKDWFKNTTDFNAKQRNNLGMFYTQYNPKLQHISKLPQPVENE